MRRLLGATGRVLVTTGILLLLFVAYQLWGTGIYEARAQNRLRGQFANQLEEQGQTPLGATTTTVREDPTVSTTPPTTVPAPALAPQNGDAMGFIRIDKIGLGTGDPAAVIEGVDVDDLRQGTGHYPTTPLPGQEGNSAIAGHRTTYGHPFGDLDQLAKGDTIVVQTLQGTFTYIVDQDPFAVDPDNGDVLLPEPDPARPGRSPRRSRSRPATRPTPRRSGSSSRHRSSSRKGWHHSRRVPARPEPPCGRSAGCRATDRRGPRPCSGESSSRSSGCSGGGSSTATRVGRRGSWA